mmetsp:Transcript_35116/g.108396  ORF Transcript_35116/g.108396 Transcript_35116/m.108396 type:complete len:301 (+) Transcript_35116:257-1159(+)
MVIVPALGARTNTSYIVPSSDAAGIFARRSSTAISSGSGFVRSVRALSCSRSASYRRRLAAACRDERRCAASCSSASALAARALAMAPSATRKRSSASANAFLAFSSSLPFFLPMSFCSVAISCCACGTAVAPSASAVAMASVAAWSAVSKRSCSAAAPSTRRFAFESAVSTRTTSACLYDVIGTHTRKSYGVSGRSSPVSGDSIRIRRSLKSAVTVGNTGAGISGSLSRTVTMIAPRRRKTLASAPAPPSPPCTLIAIVPLNPRGVRPPPVTAVALVMANICVCVPAMPMPSAGGAICP